MRVLITGHRGFIGSWLSDELRANGYEVGGVDRVGAYKAPDGRPVDLLDPGAVVNAFDAHRPDLVVHLAAQVGRLFGEDDLRHTVRSNAEMTALVAGACADRGIRLAFASTSEVYGDQGQRVCREDDPLVFPHNLYGLSKRWGEEVCRLYAPEGLTVFRFSMPYGPGVPPGRGRRAMDTMLWQAHHRMPITVHRGAERSWCWIGDTVRGARLALESGGGTFNIGRDDDPRTMLWLAREACALTGAPEGLIEVVDPPPMQTVVKRLSTDKLRRLGWGPTVELEEGIATVLAHVRTYDLEAA